MNLPSQSLNPKSLSEPNSSSAAPPGEFSGFNSSHQYRTVVQHYANSIKEDSSHKSTFFSSTPNSALDLPVFEENGHPEVDMLMDQSVKELQDSNFYQYKDSSSKDLTNFSINVGNTSTNTLNLNNLINDILEEEHIGNLDDSLLSKDVSYHQQLLNSYEQVVYSNNAFYGFQDSSFEDQDTLDTRGLIQSYQQILSRTDSSSRSLANVVFGPSSETSSMFIKKVHDYNNSKSDIQPMIEKSNQFDEKSNEKKDLSKEEEPNQPPEAPLIDPRTEEEPQITEGTSSSPCSEAQGSEKCELRDNTSSNYDGCFENKINEETEAVLPVTPETSVDKTYTSDQKNSSNQIAQSECLPTHQVEVAVSEAENPSELKKVFVESSRSSRGRGRGRGRQRGRPSGSLREENEVHKQSIIAPDVSVNSVPHPGTNSKMNRNSRKRKAPVNEDFYLVSDTNKNRKRTTRCKTCGPCLAPDCGKCIYCLDKPKFGGPNKKKCACIHRKCILMSANVLLSNMKSKKVTDGIKTSAKVNRGADDQMSTDVGFKINMENSHDDIPVDIIGHTDDNSHTKKSVQQKDDRGDYGSIANVESTSSPEEASSQTDNKSAQYKKREPLVLDPPMIVMLKNSDAQKMIVDIDKDIEKLINDEDQENYEEGDDELEKMFVSDEIIDVDEDIVSITRRNTGQL